MTTATTALRDAADTIRDAAETGIQSIGGLLEDAKNRVEAVHIPSVSIPKIAIKQKGRGRGWLGWLLVAGIVAAVAVKKSRKKDAAASTSHTPQREPVAA